MLNQYIETIFYHYALQEVPLAMKMEPDFFESTVIQTAFKLAKEYVLKYHEAPSAIQLKELAKISGDDATLTPDLVDILYSAKNTVHDYTPDWLYDNATAWAQWKNFLKSLQGTVSYIKLHQDEVSPENVKEIMEHARGFFNKSCVIDFEENDQFGSDFWNAESHLRKQLVRSATGYDFMDLCLDGGYYPGCLVCLVGAPKIGKSLWLQNLCAKSVSKGENNAYISLELPEEMIHNRIGANLFTIPALNYSKYVADQPAFKAKMNTYKKSCVIPPGALQVKSFPTSTLSVPELETWLLATEERLSTENYKFKFKNVFLDYINIMKNYRNPNSENTYMKIKQIAEDVKAMGIKNGWCIITATQTTRAQYDSSDMTGSQVSESVGLAATVDLMLGIIATSAMKLQGEYYIKCLYDRVSPQDNKRKKFNLIKEYLRIEEDPSSPIEDVIETMNRSSYPTRVGGPNSTQPTVQATPSAPQMSGAPTMPAAPTIQLKSVDLVPTDASVQYAYQQSDYYANQDESAGTVNPIYPAGMSNAGLSYPGSVISRSVAVAP